ncbi:MAG: acetyl-CoA carboxylase, biotin carboxyl carrier protein, partial [Cyanobacteria bacterium J06649_11]
MPLDFNEIRQLLATIAQTDISEVNLKSEDFELTVRKGVQFINQVAPEVVALQPQSAITSPEIPYTTAENLSRGTSDTGNGGQANAASTAKDSKF